MKSPSTNLWSFMAIIGVLLLTGLQVWAAQDSKSRTAELHALLVDTQTQAMQIMQNLGYGGLIHNFKNQVLRPDAAQYRDRTIEAANSALSLAESLERNASKLGIDAALDNTRAMISAYRERVDLVAQMHSEGLSITEIDRAVYFNDDFAVREIETLVDNLSVAVDERVNKIATRRTQFLIGTIVATGVLLSIALGLILNQRQKEKYLLMMNDLNTRLEHSNNELKNANTSLRQFAGIVSHDLKAPLRHIRQFNEFVLEDYADQTLVEEHVGRIRHSSKRMESLIASLLEFAQAGFSKPKLMAIDVSELVTQVVSEMQPSINSASAKVTVNLQGRVLADRELMERVFYNLLGNSIKYAKPDTSPVIDIATTRQNDHIRFSVTDNGIGIDPKHAERIFIPMQRLHDSDSHFEGHGIGLSLVKSVIEAHGGRVWLDTSYNNGSRFEFELKAVNETSTFDPA